MDHLYVTVEAFQESASIPDGLGTADVERALAAASRAVENMCQRRSFGIDDAESTRVYTAVGPGLVMVDDMVSLTSVTSDGTTLTPPEDYMAQPLNAAVDGQPIMWLESPLRRFCRGTGKIAVTGLFGWPQLPDPVEQFVAIVAGKLLKRTREAPFGIVTAGGMEGQALRLARTDPDACMLIEPYVRNYPAVL